MNLQPEIIRVNIWLNTDDALDYWLQLIFIEQVFLHTKSFINIILAEINLIPSSRHGCLQETYGESRVGLLQLDDGVEGGSEIYWIPILRNSWLRQSEVLELGLYGAKELRRDPGSAVPVEVEHELEPLAVSVDEQRLLGPLRAPSLGDEDGEHGVGVEEEGAAGQLIADPAHIKDDSVRHGNSVSPPLVIQKDSWTNQISIE